MVESLSPSAFDYDESSFFEDAQMLHDREPRELEPLDQSACGHRFGSQVVENGPSTGVGERLPRSVVVVIRYA